MKAEEELEAKNKSEQKQTTLIEGDIKESKTATAPGMLVNREVKSIGD
jgi:hypothetical protein